MNKNISELYNLLQEIAWHFGSQGFNGECCKDLSLVEYMALKKIYEYNKLSIQDVGNALNFTKSGATRIIDRLESKGYVLRKRSPKDGRVCCAVITDKGKEVIIETIKNYTSYLEDVLKEFESQKVEGIKDSLEILVNAIQQDKQFNSEIIIHKEVEEC
jgi:DNA-binding MarR family transcriptional regulator